MDKNKKYNFTESRKFKISLAVVCSIFIYLFLIFFQPFGVNNYQPNQFLSLELAIELSAIIPALFLTIFLNEMFLRPVVIDNSALKQLIPWFLWEFILVGSSSFLLYNYLGDFHDFSLTSYIYHILEVSSVLIFPFFGTLFFFRFSRIKKDYDEILSVSKEISNINELVLISGDYKKDQIALQMNNVLVIESEDNYVGINYLENNQIKKYLVRSTLLKIDKFLRSELIVRCNRSHIVNLHQLESYKNISNKLFLKINQYEKEVLVSKSHYDKVMNLLEKSIHVDLSDSVHP
jgi:hypothetical protein